jgi:hypothetical protein
MYMLFSMRQAVNAVNKAIESQKKFGTSDYVPHEPCFNENSPDSRRATKVVVDATMPRSATQKMGYFR